ncbi:uncharacterized protein BDR25DRAFT_307277 [Lindgomyces ingoldianus]|uniref:Uncharacterized protein n=1 Tax=Lindgomyces ingoldianus TaxID=673940 RepID=A0ACB6QBI7_9PLEO|nr:uncharacterized protein BDR25DRAFT_307277 [Lindgomyces ingoldianus]KAF2464261.1 hypothetical protein BDR25DRAFT_307277 [Lindgomyces ingoldianus]
MPHAAVVAQAILCIAIVAYVRLNIRLVLYYFLDYSRRWIHRAYAFAGLVAFWLRNLHA